MRAELRRRKMREKSSNEPHRRLLGSSRRLSHARLLSRDNTREAFCAVFAAILFYSTDWRTNALANEASMRIYEHNGAFSVSVSPNRNKVFFPVGAKTLSSSSTHKLRCG